MADPDDRPAADVQASSEETVIHEREEDGIVGLLDGIALDDESGGDDRETSDASPAIENGAVSNRYRQILREQADDVSEEGSVDAAPRRVGSPIDSLLSVPDDSPSVQASEAPDLAMHQLTVD